MFGALAGLKVNFSIDRFLPLNITLSGENDFVANPSVVVVGGGAAGYFCALSAAESNPNLSILLLEGGNQVLRKVRNSGGGRCNLTHHCFDPNELSQHYPRGGRQLKGAFYHWHLRDTI